MAEDNTCPICLDKFTASIRKPVTCGQCRADTCSKCVEKYLLNTIEDSHCPHCRYAWPRAFLNTVCTSTFLNKTYYKYRQDILMNRERSFLPQMMVFADRERRARKIDSMVQEVYKEELEFRKEYEKKLGEFATRRQKLWQKSNRLRAGYDDDAAEGAAGTGEKKEPAKKFVRRCTATDCKGFLSSVWKCGVCENWVCPECFEVKGKNKDVEHTCKPEMLETAKLIKKDSKPCPSCGEMIMKAEGCFAADTPVLSYDGSVILSQNIKVGDQLIGDDGEVRVVERIMSGVDEMYEVIQTNGKSTTSESATADGLTYTVNSKHKLALINTIGDIVEIEVDKYIQLPQTIKNTLLGFKKNGDRITTSRITVTSIGPGTYYGWSVTGGTNKRFVLDDFTVVRNCDQMWCTSCHTPFSWQTGTVITTGIIHNPHYYQWMRNGGGGQMPQHPGHIPCGGLPGPYNLRRTLRNVSEVDIVEFLNVYRTCVHMIEVERTRYERHVQPQNNRDLDVRYLMNELDEEDWKAALAKEEKDRKKSREIREILDAFNGATIDIMRRIEIRPTAPYERQEGLALTLEIRTELNALREYIIGELMKVSKAFNCSVPYIDDDWNVCHGTAQTIRRRAKEAVAATEIAATAVAARGGTETTNIVTAHTPTRGGAGAPIDG
jgi:hypothetical protein